MAHKIIDYTIGGHELKLMVDDEVFVPNITTQLIADHVTIEPGARVLDLGCGVGPLAIWAAKEGASKVYAVDIQERACMYARENIRLNGVEDRVEVLHGNLFEPLEGLKFDIIIDDVSGVSDAVARISPWFPQPVPTGGEDGTGPTIQMLSQAQAYFAEKCKLYFPVLSLADSAKIVSKARELYDGSVEEIAQKMIPFCEEFKTHLDLFESLKSEGVVDYVKRRSRYLWKLQVYCVHAASA